MLTIETQALTLEDVPNIDKLKAGFFRLEWDGWGPEFVLSISGDQSWGSDAVLEVGTSEKEEIHFKIVLWKSILAFQVWAKRNKDTTPRTFGYVI